VSQFHCTDAQCLAAALQAKLTPEEALREANDVLRSAAVIAAREGRQTNWPRFGERVHEALRHQHRLMYPDQHPTSPQVCSHGYRPGECTHYLDGGERHACPNATEHVKREAYLNDIGSS